MASHGRSDLGPETAAAGAGNLAVRWFAQSGPRYGRAYVAKPIDDHFLESYRRLLDAEDEAFDELEHACEDGDRPHFDMELGEWQQALAAKISFLRDAGYQVPAVVGAG